MGGGVDLAASCGEVGSVSAPLEGYIPKLHMPEEDIERHMLEITLRVQGLDLNRYERLVELRRKHAEAESATPAPEAAE